MSGTPAFVVAVVVFDTDASALVVELLQALSPPSRCESSVDAALFSAQQAIFVVCRREDPGISWTLSPLPPAPALPCVIDTRVSVGPRAKSGKHPSVIQIQKALGFSLVNLRPSFSSEKWQDLRKLCTKQRLTSVSEALRSRNTDPNLHYVTHRSVVDRAKLFLPLPTFAPPCHSLVRAVGRTRPTLHPPTTVCVSIPLMLLLLLFLVSVYALVVAVAIPLVLLSLLLLVSFFALVFMVAIASVVPASGIRASQKKIMGVLSSQAQCYPGTQQEAWRNGQIRCP